MQDEPRGGERPRDLVVIGGGMGGLAAAALAQRLGLDTALLEAHTRLGGCAGYFPRGPYTFDVGATALMGVGPGEPVGDLLDVLGAPFTAEPSSAYRVHLPDRRLDIVDDPDRFIAAVLAVFPTGDGLAPAALRRFWRLQQAVGARLVAAATEIVRLPVSRPADLAHDLRILGVRGLLAAMTSAVTVDDVLRLLDLGRDRGFRALVAMLLQDTAQAGPETVPFANAAACLYAYRAGMSRPRGGMHALVEGIGRRFAELGGDLRTATLVDRVEVLRNDREPGTGRGEANTGARFAVVTRRRQRIFARQVVFNLPLDLAARLLDRPLSGRLARAEQKSRAAWSAFTGYLAIDRKAVPDDAPLFHQVLRSYDRPLHDANNVLVSLSPLDDPGYGPATVRVATLSTHTRPAGWESLDREAYRQRKTEFQSRMLAALGQALPNAPNALLHAEFGSPRSVRRYTRRTLGAVGGAPVAWSNSNFLAVGSDVLGPGLWVVGDSVFPGQSTMATVLSAIRVIERIAGVSWAAIRALPRPRRSVSPHRDQPADRIVPFTEAARVVLMEPRGSD